MQRFLRWLASISYIVAIIGATDSARRNLEIDADTATVLLLLTISYAIVMGLLYLRQRLALKQ